MSGPLGVGIIGAGMISDQYLTNLTSFPDIRVAIVGDLLADRAQAQAEKYGVPEHGSPEDVLEHPEVELVVNLTIPAAHHAVSAAAIAAGKHVWTEKPLGVSRAEAADLVRAAAAAGVRLGVAPDTVLGPGLQTARRAILRGDIGEPLSASTSMAYFGPDIFHPDPEFLFAHGGGPLLDMGPYYVTALVHLLGRVSQVAALGLRGRDTRRIQVGPRAGTEFPVSVPTHVQALLRFSSGATGQSIFSFDSPLTRTGLIEITGTEATMVVPDPNTFGGEVRITRAPGFGQEQEWFPVAPAGVLAGRGLGVLDMARAIRGGGAHIASGEVGLHVLDTLLALEEAVASPGFVDVTSPLADIPLVPDDRDPFTVTL